MRRGLLMIGLSVFLLACAPQQRPAGPEIAAPRLNGDHFVAADGALLPVRAWLPQTAAPKAVIVALHGFNDYSNFFAAPATYFQSNGIAAYAFDQRGFGAAPHPGLWAGTEAMIGDLSTFVKLLRARHPEAPLYILGESMGGAVAMVWAARLSASDAPPADGLILAAPAVWGRSTMPFYQTGALWLSAHLMPGARLTGRGLDIMASDNIEMLLALGRDPLVIKESRIDAVYGLADLMDAALEASRRLDASALILYGEKDEIIPRAPTEEMLARLPAAAASRRKVIFYENGYHMLLRDLAAESVWADIRQWIEGGPGGIAARTE